jgi:membrane protein required for beta-lactamase induction
MTAEIAAVREQMEARTLAHRRRSGVWAWLKWMLWVVVRQIIWDVALLGVLLIWMRMRGDRRLEVRLREGWSGVKARLGRVKLLRRVPPMP